MRRRLLPLVLAVLALVVPAGCADTVSPAVRVNDEAIGNEELLDEVEQWAGNPLLLQSLQFPADLAEGDAPGSYSTELVGFVLGSRVGFELHRAEFERRDLELDQQVVEQVRSQLFGPPEVTDQVFANFSGGYGDRLVRDIARQVAVEDELAVEYQTWITDAYESADVEVNPRYGSWDAETGQVVPPAGPSSADAPAA